MKGKKTILLVLIILATALMLPTGDSVHAASDPGNFIFDISEGNITVGAGDGGYINVTYGTPQTQTADFATSQEITITGSSPTNKVTVNIPGQTANITLSGTEIELDSGDDCAFSIDNGTVNLTLVGTNILESTGGNPGLRVPSGTTLTIDGAGSLTATGAANAAGIGGGNSVVNGTITINGGNITATGGCTGIGTGSADFTNKGGDITITGGTVTATGGTNGAGIGCGGAFSEGGDINISGGTVTATGGSFGAGIGNNSGNITINGGTVTTTGGSYSSGISCDYWKTLTISDPATVVAVAGGASPAIYAKDNVLAGTAYVLMANFLVDKSSGTTTDIYLKADSSLQASFAPEIAYKSIAFTLPAADTYELYTANIQQQHAGGTDFTINSAGLTIFNIDIIYTVTVKKDGADWSEDTPDIELSTANDALAGAVTGTCEDGIYTFTGLDPSLTYYVWDTTNNQYTGQSVSAASTDATVNYYTVTLTEGTGIDSTTGGGVYLSGSDVVINAVVADDYIWNKWIQTDNGTLVSKVRNYTITNITEAQSYTAKAMTIRADGIAWIDAGHYDDTLYQTLIADDFAATTVEISTPQQLAAVARAQDIDGIDFCGVTFELTQDIDLSGYLWDPIGLAEGDPLYGAADGNAHPFLGCFNGNGHLISSMTIEGSYVSAGLFGNVGPNSDGLIMISNVTVAGTIELTDTEYIGGIIGSGNRLILQNCINNTAITCVGDDIVAGGIIGFGMLTLLEGCYNETDAAISLTATSPDPETTAGAGGIAGVIFAGSIYNSANFASVAINATGDGSVIASGIAALSLLGTVNNCYNTGAVSAEGSDSRAGGICGLDIDAEDLATTLLQNCYNAGLVTASKAAGIAAQTDAIDGCYYLSGTAPYAYYDPDDNPVDGSTMSDAEMQADAFCQTLNDWVAAHPVSSGFTETTMGLDGVAFQGWVRQDGVNNGYPVFTNDPRYGSPLPHRHSFVSNNTPTEWQNPYLDVDSADWFYDAVAFVSQIGLMNGMSENMFGPGISTSRAMIVSFLWRLEDQPATDGGGGFTDVGADQWFSEAIAWAAGNDIVLGYNAQHFGPNDGITREQFAAILYRYAITKGYDVSAQSSLENFVDAAQTSAWALDAVEWAVAEGFLGGVSDTMLAPGGSATRAQAAEILMRFVEKFQD